MPEKKNSHTKTISDSDLLAMYEKILPLLYFNPDKLDIAFQINKFIFSFVPYDFLHYSKEGEAGPKKFNTQISTWSGFGEQEKLITISKAESEETENFEDKVEQNRKNCIQQWLDSHSGKAPAFHYYRLEAADYPKFSVGFFRHKTSLDDNNFTTEELAKFEYLKPHMFRLFRVALTQVERTDAFRYFDSFAKIGSQIATEHDLSEAETKLLPDILFGYSNEEIAERHFVSQATVKTHVNHIFKKTGTKNRVDFISKFFTSPEHVQL